MNSSHPLGLMQRGSDNNRSHHLSASNSVYMQDTILDTLPLLLIQQNNTMSQVLCRSEEEKSKVQMEQVAAQSYTAT